MVRHNNVVHNVHFHKDWQARIKCWFNQPAKAKKRRLTRVKKAARIAPRPAQKLRPIVRCPTALFNIKQRLGRGFSTAELRAAGLNERFARTIGIAVDLRRRNKSVEGLQINVQRLKEYRSKLILFPKNPKKNPKTEEDKLKSEAMKAAKQYIGTILPLQKDTAQEAPRAILRCERKFSAYKELKKNRNAVRFKADRERKRQRRLEEKQEAKKGDKKGAKGAAKKGGKKK